MSSTLQTLLSPTSQILPNTAAVIGIFPSVMGVACLINPRFGFSVFDQRPVSNPESQKLVDNLMRLFGARDVYLGLTNLIAWQLNDRVMLGYCTLLGTGVVIVDGLVQKWQTGEGEWRHWGFVPVTALLGAGLAGWLDGMV
ncbi:hypothetical protein BAUCODRAFT_148763 [Baudoinia panamericana UAMH 10762]|uniref:Uncharacterized protein n=1 Tax=Baudoinia panamericana (strain UAMH 10762) TaxID=717646 RepID=M2MWI4_BAUPA|nr:uncharacterized protein BAUCODRAFT_148763 [Baudoinia panamericana UAMH 10762]EMC95908.1 hypothetical protein BAUCODRAFT_148763 [Baudoinia panamericana UAMH 10762]